MTPKQQRFIDEYLVDLNATQAAIRAGYSRKTANEIGAENLAKPSIAEAISKALAEQSERTGITADMVIRELARIGFADMSAYATWGGDRVLFIDSKELGQDATAAIAEVASVTTTRSNKDGDEITTTVNSKFKLHDKRGALELLGKHLGLFPTQHNLSGSIDINVNDFASMSEEELKTCAADLARRAEGLANRNGSDPNTNRVDRAGQEQAQPSTN